MSPKKRCKLEARLRVGQDDDLRRAIEDISEGALSELVRDGMRLMLGIRTKMTVELKEKPLVLPASDLSETHRQTAINTLIKQKEKTVQLQSKPTVFKPNMRPNN